jgi:hypothetical protein
MQKTTISDRESITILPELKPVRQHESAGGHSIKEGTGATRARSSVDTVQDVRVLLADLARTSGAATELLVSPPVR